MVDERSRPVDGGKYFTRNLHLYLEGFGLGISIVKLITCIIQYKRVAQKQQATYDRVLHLNVVTGTPVSSSICILVFILLIVVQSFLVSAFLIGNMTIQ